MFRTRDSGDFSVSGTGRNEFVEEFILRWCLPSFGIWSYWDFEALASTVGVFLVFGTVGVGEMNFLSAPSLFCNQLKWELDFEERRVSFMK